MSDFADELGRHVRSVAHVTFNWARDDQFQVVHLERKDGIVISDPAGALEQVIAQLTDEYGGVIIRADLDRMDPVANVWQHEVRGYSIIAGEWDPVPKDELFSAVHTDTNTGEPLSPEPGVILAADVPDSGWDGKAFDDDRRQTHQKKPQQRGPSARLDNAALTADRAAAQEKWQTLADAYGLAEAIGAAPDDWSADSANQVLVKIVKAEILAALEARTEEISAAFAEFMAAVIIAWDIQVEIAMGTFSGALPNPDQGSAQFQRTIENIREEQLFNYEFPAPGELNMPQSTIDQLSPERQARWYELVAQETSLSDGLTASADKVRHQTQLTVTWLTWQRMGLLQPEQSLWSQDAQQDQQLFDDMGAQLAAVRDQDNDQEVDREPTPIERHVFERDVLTTAEFARMAQAELAASRQTITAAQYDVWSDHYPERLLDQYQDVDVVNLSWLLPDGKVYFDFDDRQDWPHSLMLIGDDELDIEESVFDDESFDATWADDDDDDWDDDQWDDDIANESFAGLEISIEGGEISFEEKFNGPDEGLADCMYLHGALCDRGVDYLAIRPIISWFDELNPAEPNHEMIRLPLPTLVIASPEVAARFPLSLRVDPKTGDISSNFPDWPENVSTKLEIMCLMASVALSEITQVLQGYHLRKLASRAHPQGSKKRQKKRRKK